MYTAASADVLDNRAKFLNQLRVGEKVVAEYRISRIQFLKVVKGLIISLIYMVWAAAPFLPLF